MAKAKKSRKKSKIPALFTRLRKHFGADPAKLPVIEQSFPGYDRANLHLTLAELLTASKPPTALVGVLNERYSGLSLAKLAHKGRAPIEQIQTALGHASIQTTERYLGVEQDLTDAPCDHLGIRVRRGPAGKDT